MAGVGRLVGATGKWTKQALLAFLEDLRPKLSDLDEREQYEILQQGGQMPALPAVLGGASPMAVLRDLSGGGTVIEHALKESSRLEVSDELLDEDSIRARLKVPLPPDIRRRVRRRHGDFSEMTRRWNTSKSRTTHDRLQLDPSEWYLYQTLYREARKRWPEQPYERLAEQVRARPDWVVGDFGCGECVFADAVQNQVISMDHVACRNDVRVCDMAVTGSEANSLDAAVFSLSLMGTNWPDYLREARKMAWCPEAPAGAAYRRDRTQSEQHADAMSEPQPSSGYRVRLPPDYTEHRRA